MPRFCMLLFTQPAIRIRRVAANFSPSRPMLEPERKGS
jgi:hypothetical protein